MMFTFAIRQHPALVLSPRELEVVKLLAQGLGVTEIATELCRSKKTVETYTGLAQVKLGLSNMNQLRCVAALCYANLELRPDNTKPKAERSTTMAR